MEFVHAVKVSNHASFLEKYIDVFCAVGVDSKFWLADTEKKFYIQCITLYNQGVDLLSEDAMHTLMISFSHTKDPEQSVYQYRTKLKKKFWLIPENGTLTIPSIFDFRAQVEPEVINFSLNVELV